jgi:hypothetical protein
VHRARPVVPSSLEELHGPPHGVLVVRQGALLRPHEYDLDDPRELIEAYSHIIEHAHTSHDLLLLDKSVLVRLWPHLRLPGRHVIAWQEMFAELR